MQPPIFFFESSSFGVLYLYNEGCCVNRRCGSMTFPGGEVKFTPPPTFNDPVRTPTRLGLNNDDDEVTTTVFLLPMLSGIVWRGHS